MTKTLHIKVEYALEIDEEDVDWLMQSDNDDGAEKKYVLREYRNRQNPYMEFLLKCEDKTGYFETY